MHKAAAVKMSQLQIGLISVLLTALMSCTLVQIEMASDEDQVFTKPTPEFPTIELARGREGWVLIVYRVSSSGIVGDLYIKDSSGNSAFEDAALNAVRQWRYKPDKERELSVLLNFVYDRNVVQLSRKFSSLNNSAHTFIDNGDLEAAHELLAEIRGDDDLNAFELAYSLLTEGRIAGEYGDRAGQLYYFRKAMLNDGRWLARENYLACLRAAVILEIELGDFVTAVRDYEILTATRVGQKLGADLEDSIQAISAQVEADRLVTPPYVFADSSVSVERAKPRYPESIGPMPREGTRDSMSSRPSKKQ